MKLLYSRTVHQEAEREVEFCLDPFNQADWHVKNEDGITTVLGWMHTEEYMDYDELKLVTVDNAVIQELWGASISDLKAYIKEVRTNDTNIIRSYETEVSIDGHRQTVPIHLKLHGTLDTKGVGFDLEHEYGFKIYAEVQWWEELVDEDYQIYDAENHKVDII